MVFVIFIIFSLQMGKKTYTFPLAASPGRPLQISVNDGGGTTSWGDLALPLARWCHTLCLIKSSSWVKVVDLRNKANQDKTEIQVFWSTWCTGPLRKRTIWDAEAGEEGYLLPGGPGGHVRVMLGPPMQSSDLLHPTCNPTQTMRDKPNRAGCHGGTSGEPQSPMMSICKFTIYLGKQLSYKWSPLFLSTPITVCPLLHVAKK